MKILFHICCSNCTLFPFKIIKEEGHDFSGLWYNPNIHPYKEYNLRLKSLKKLSDMWKIDVEYLEEYRPGDYFTMFNITDKKLINDICSGEIIGSNGPDSSNDFPGFPDRCKSCYLLRLEKTAEHAKKQGFNSFSTTLLISPYQDIELIVSTGNTLAEKYNIMFYYKDFRPWFRQAMNQAGELELYRQKYCGCIFSREERKQKKQLKRSNV